MATNVIDPLQDLAFFHQPETASLSDNKEKGGFIRVLAEPIVNGFKAVPQLTTGFANLLKNQSRYAHPYVERDNEGGNFCGHDPANPRFVMQHNPYFEPAEIDDLGCKRRPQILYDIVEKIKCYYDDPSVIEVLHMANAHQRTSDKQRRSEFREAIVNLLSVMVMYMDLGSLRVGQPTKEGGFFNYSIEWMAEKAKLSLSRANRALSAINDAMLIHSYQFRELVNEEKKEYIAHNASRVFDLDFFKMLDIDQQKLGKARKLAHKKQQDKETAHQSTLSDKEQAVLNLNMKKVMRGIDPKKPSLNKINAAQNEDEKDRIARLHNRRTQVLLDLSHDPRFHGDSEALYAAAKQRFQELGLLTDNERAT